MAVLECCEGCGSKVESNQCCGVPMGVEGDMLVCKNCGKDVSVNRCCGKTMKEKK